MAKRNDSPRRDKKDAAPAKGVPVKGGVVNPTDDWASGKSPGPRSTPAPKR
jgi:hypothetical protein